MPDLFEQLKQVLPGARFGLPAAPAQISRAEAVMAFSFPDWLRELYRATNGIGPSDGPGTYLYPIERDEPRSDSLIGVNQFFREEWERNLHAGEEFRPEINWRQLHPRDLLIIAGYDQWEWALHRGPNSPIIIFDVRNPDDRRPVAPDFLTMCINWDRLLAE